MSVAFNASQHTGSVGLPLYISTSMQNNLLCPLPIITLSFLPRGKPYLDV